MIGEFEIEENSEFDWEDEEGNSIAHITLGQIKDELNIAEFQAHFGKLLERIPVEFQDKATVSLGYGYCELIYERPVTADEKTKIEAEEAAQQEKATALAKERRRERYLELKEEFDPDPSGEAHEPPDYSAQAQLDQRTSDYQTEETEAA